MANSVSIDKTKAGYGVILSAFERAKSCAAHGVLRTHGDGRTAAAELLVELLSKRFAEQVKSEGIHARVGEGEDACTDAGDEMGH